ncbi:MAG: glycosyltransferase family 2 protein [Thermoplasmata archaeon]
MREISILVPAYQEAENLRRLVREIEEALTGWNYETIIINDGSTDGSNELICELEVENGKIKGLFSERRRGKTRAIQDGFEASTGEIVVIMDADLQYSAKDIPRLVDGLESADVVNGLRTDRQDGIDRRLVSSIYNYLVRAFFNVDFRDCNSGLKVFRRDALAAIVHQLRRGWHRYLLVLADRSGFRVIEMPIHHRKRTMGESKYFSPGRLLKGFYDMANVLLSTSRTEEVSSRSV